jgi:hypothetical protein
MAKCTDTEAPVVLIFSVIVGVGTGLLSSHWLGYAGSTGVGLLAFIVAFCVFAQGTGNAR